MGPGIGGLWAPEVEFKLDFVVTAQRRKVQGRGWEKVA